LQIDLSFLNDLYKLGFQVIVQGGVQVKVNKINSSLRIHW